MMKVEMALAQISIFGKLCRVQSKKKTKNEVDVSSKLTNMSEETCCDDVFGELSLSFEMLLERGMSCNEYYSVEEKLCWLRSQIIGNHAEFNTPFGRRKLVYADHTASGRSLHYIENFIANHLLPFYGNTHTCDSYVGSRTTTILNQTTEYIKKCLGGGKDDALIFCGSGTTAAIKRLQEVMGIVVPSIMRERLLKSLSKEERWVVFVGPHEHHSNLLSWRQSLAEVVEIGQDNQGLLDMDALKLQLEAYKHSNRPLLGSFSACSNVTGIYSNTRAIARLLHQYKGFACFDFAASGPYVEIDMRSGRRDGYDAVFLSPHKFLGGPDSPGILLMSNVLYQLRSSPPSTCGGGTVSYVNGFNEKDTLYLENIEERENGGTPPIIQTVRAALAFAVKHNITCKEIEKREELFINKALERLTSNPNIEILGNISTKRQAILSFVIYSTTNSSSPNRKRGKLLHGPFVATLLNDLFGIQARGGCACAGPYGHQLLNINHSQSLAVRSAIQEGFVGAKPGWTRVSFPYYMDEEDFEFILAAIEFVAIYGQKFLPLYSFNLRDGSWKIKTMELEALTKEMINCNFKEETNSDLKEDTKYNVKVKQDGILRRKSYLGCVWFARGRNMSSIASEQVNVWGSSNTKANTLLLAKFIASCLSMFPSETMVQGDVDPSVLHFIV